MSHAALATRWRAEPGQARALALAIAMHGVLAVLLVVGVSWQSRPPAPVFAELWTPPPAPAAMPAPPVQPSPSSPPQRAEPPAPPAPKVDLALEQQRKAEDARRRAAEQAAEARAREQRLEERRKAEAAAREKERLARETREKAAREKEQREKEAKAREAKEQQAREKADEALRERLRERVLEQASKDAAVARPPATGAAASAAAAAQAQAAAFGEAGYLGRLRATIRANTVFAPAVEPAGNPEAVFVVTLAPDCAVLGVSLKRGSGLKAWDDAAERALRRTDPFPRPPNVACPSSLEIAHRLRD